MANIRNRTGERFGRLTVVRQAAKNTARPGAHWLCRCECGNEKVLVGSDLGIGKTSSCGCLLSEHITTVNKSLTKHGHAKSAGGNKRLTTPTYGSWKAMLYRVRNPDSKDYPRYGGRGIAVCDRWCGPDGFANFLADMGERPKGKTLDREDNDGDYEPNNCRWATPIEQRANQRSMSPEAEARRLDALRRGRELRWASKSS
jgi:hypothetical protein